MMLIEQTVVADATLPVAEFRDYLRLGSGFAEGGVDEAALTGCLRASLATIEARTSKAVFKRVFKWTVSAWRDLASDVLPIAPVGALISVELVDINGIRESFPVEKFRIQMDAHKPRLVSKSWALPTIPVGGQIEVVFEAGFGETWESVPRDLAEAVLMLGAHYHDVRGAIGEGPAGIPQGVQSLLSQYRVIRLFGGF